MTAENAEKIISDNCYCNENSFVYFLHEECYFSVESFWEYYESIAFLAGLSMKEKKSETTMQISLSYQRILKEIIYHFDPHDVAVMKSFPDDYTGYIERLDFAVLAYYSGNIGLIEDEGFQLQK